MEKIVDSLDGVAEHCHQFYEKKADGKYHLQDISALRNSLTNVRGERDRFKTAAQQVEAWQALGKTPEEIKALVDAAAEEETNKSVKAGEWEKLKQQMVEQHTTALSGKDTEIKRYRTALEEHLITGQASTALAEAKGSPVLLLPHVQKHTRVVEQDGKFGVVVVDAKGDPRVDAQGAPVTLKALIEEMKKDDQFARAFDGSGHSGSGASQIGRGGGAPPAGTTRSKMNTTQKVAFIRDNGQAAYLALPS